jgi:hypothetical protein
MSAEGKQNPFIRLGDAIDPALLRGASAPAPAPAPPPPEPDAPARRADAEFYSELNLNRFPFASLFDKDTGKPGAIVVRRELRAGRTGSLFEWVVSPGESVPSASGGPRGGLPGPFDRRVFRALEKIVMGRSIMKGEPLANPQPIEIKEVLETLRLTVQTHNYRSVTRALGRLQGTQISCTGLVKAGQAAPARGVTFSPLSEIRWAGEADPETGLRIDRTRIYFAPFYLESVNSFNVRPIDWDLWLALGPRPLAQRLYEILEMGFFGLKDSPYKHFGYAELCQLLPSRPQAKKSDAMRVLGRAHEELKEVEVKRPGGAERLRLLDRVEWHWDGPDAALRYYPHREYLARLRRRKTPQFDPRALELAKEFQDMDSLAFYQLVVGRIDWQYIQAARTEVRSNRRVADPRRYFSATLRKILRGVGVPVPFGEDRSLPRG